PELAAGGETFEAGVGERAEAAAVDADVPDLVFVRGGGFAFFFELLSQARDVVGTGRHAVAVQFDDVGFGLHPAGAGGANDVGRRRTRAALEDGFAAGAKEPQGCRSYAFCVSSDQPPSRPSTPSLFGRLVALAPIGA